MGYFAESFAELYNADGWIDMGMYIGAGSSMPGWYTVIASVMLWRFQSKETMTNKITTNSNL